MKPDEAWDAEAMEKSREAAEAAAARTGCSPGQAEDVGQDVVVDIMAKRIKVRNAGAFGNSAGRLRAISELRRESRHATPTVLEDLDTPSNQPSIERQVIAQVMVDALSELVGDLPAKQRLAFEALREAGGQMGDAIRLLAGMTDMTEATIRTHLRRAKDKALAAVPESERTDWSQFQ